MRVIGLLMAVVSVSLLSACERRQEAAPGAPATAGAPAAAETSGRAAEAGGSGAPAPRKIVVRRGHFTEQQLAEFKTVAPGATIVVTSSLAEDRREAADADALLTDELTADTLRGAKRLKWIQYYAAGVDDIAFPQLTESDIVLTNAKIIQGPEIADHGFALLLALTRRLHEIIARQSEMQSRAAHYRRPANWPLELQGRTALVVGMGGIGVQIAQRAHAFGMRVIGVDPKDIPYMLFVEASYKPDQLRELLPDADVVFMTAPLTRETERMMGELEFRLMKRGSYFIALSRGRTFDMNALVNALETGRLAGAGLDVTDPWPLPKEHPLWKLSNVIVTPHMAGQSDRAWERRYALVRENLRRFVSGAPLTNVVDKRRGY